LSPQARAVAEKEETKRRAIRHLLIVALRVLCPCADCYNVKICAVAPCSEGLHPTRNSEAAATGLSVPRMRNNPI
jgi:hypothetical protein